MCHMNEAMQDGVDFLETQTSIPTPEAIALAEDILGYALPDGGHSVDVNSPEEFTIKQVLLHPELFERLGN